MVEGGGEPPLRVRSATAARTREETHALTCRIVEEASVAGPYIVSTSRYHAFRAALLARSLGFADEAVGGPTTFYYVPSATLREFLAVLSYRRLWFALSFLPSLGLVALLVRARSEEHTS